MMKYRNPNLWNSKADAYMKEAQEIDLRPSARYKRMSEVVTFENYKIPKSNFKKKYGYFGQDNIQDGQAPGL